MHLLVLGINSEGRPIASLLMRRRREAESASLLCYTTLMQLRRQKQEKSRHSFSLKHSNQTALRPDRTGSENVCYTSLLSCACEDAAGKMG